MYKIRRPPGQNFLEGKAPHDVTFKKAKCEFNKECMVCYVPKRGSIPRPLQGTGYPDDRLSKECSRHLTHFCAQSDTVYASWMPAGTCIRKQSANLGNY